MTLLLSLSFRRLASVIPFLLSLTIIGPVNAGVWSLEPCTPEETAGWADFERSLRQAEPGSALFLPHPFPDADEEVVENALFWHRRAFAETNFEDLPAADRRLYALLDGKQVRFEVLTLADWTPLRCRPEKPRRHSFLVRVFDAEIGFEVTRFAVAESGRLLKVSHRPLERPDVPGFAPLEPLAALQSLVERRWKLPARHLQWVHLDGQVHCNATMPCVALRDGRGVVHLFEPGRRAGEEGRLYRLPPGGPAFGAADLAPAARIDTLRRVEREGGALVSIGRDRYRMAVPIEPPSAAGSGPGSP